jgi:hypothetical protein
MSAPESTLFYFIQGAAYDFDHFFFAIAPSVLECREREATKALKLNFFLSYLRVKYAVLIRREAVQNNGPRGVSTRQTKSMRLKYI